MGYKKKLERGRGLTTRQWRDLAGTNYLSEMDTFGTYSDDAPDQSRFQRTQ